MEFWQYGRKIAGVTRWGASPTWWNKIGIECSVRIEKRLIVFASFCVIFPAGFAPVYLNSRDNFFLFLIGYYGFVGLVVIICIKFFIKLVFHFY